MKKIWLVSIHVLLVVVIAFSSNRQYQLHGQFSSGSPYVLADRLTSLPVPASLAQPNEPPPAFEEAVEQVRQLTPMFEDLYANLDRTQFDLDDLNASLSYDATALIDFVRSEISFEQYPGVLRGEFGTLIGHAGNAVDQALLLRRLLDDAGYETRLVRGRLSHDQAMALVNQMAVARSTPKPPIDQAILGDLLNRYLKMDSAQISELSEPILSDGVNLYRDATGSDTQIILDALEAAQITLGDPAIIDQLIREAQDYFWVQYRLSAFEVWTDAHPAFTDSDTAPTEVTVDTIYRDALPESLYHRFRLEVFIEQKQADELIVHPIVRGWERTAADLIGTPITFQNQPNNLDLKTTDIETLLSNADVFLAYINGDVADKGFDLNGYPFGIALISSDTIGVTSLIQSVGGALEDITGALGGLDGTQEANADDLITLTAQWIEYTLIAPDGTETTTRRYVMDRIGVSNREQGITAISGDSDVLEASKALLTSHVIMVMPTQYDPGYRAERLISQFLKEMETLDRLQAAPNLDSLPSYILSETPSIHDIFYNASISYSGSTGNNLVSYLSEPMLVVYEDGFVPCRPEATGYERVDVINNTRRVFSTADGLLQPAPVEAVRQGVWETYAERMLIRNATSVSFNTFDALREAADASIPLVILSPEDAVDVNTMPYSEQTRDAVRRDIESGYVVVIPERTAAESRLAGWWRVHPETGETLGMTSAGYGQELVEYLGTLSNLGFFVAGTLNCISGGGSADCCLAVNNAGLALGLAGGTVFALSSKVLNALVWDYYWNVAGYYAPSLC